eukprot:scaffold22969_cov89-Cyclotella_meneghiniana.AAC.9
MIPKLLFGYQVRVLSTRAWKSRVSGAQVLLIPELFCSGIEYSGWLGYKSLLGRVCYPKFVL